jgi:hypothetical protein
MISFLSPLFLAGVIAGALPLVLHLLRREPEARLPFAAVALLQNAPVEQADKRRLRELLLLALRISALVLLALAFARPYWTASAATSAGPLSVILLDTSLSLSAPGRFERARGLALQALDRAAGRVAVVTFSDVPRVAAAPGADREAARTALTSAAADFGATRYRAALATAADLIAADEQHEQSGAILLISDLQASGWDAGDRALVPAHTRVEIVDAGAPPPNLAVTHLRRAGNRLTAAVRNGGSEAREARVRFDVDAGTVGVAAVTVAAGESADVSIVLPDTLQGATASATVDDDLGAAGDNARFMVIAGAPRSTVLLVAGGDDPSREAFYLWHALTAAGADRSPYDVRGVGAGSFGTWSEERLGSVAAIVLTSTRGLDRKGRDLLSTFLNGGGGLVLTLGPQVDAQVAADILSTAGVRIGEDPAVRGSERAPGTLAPVDSRHPLFRAFGAEAAMLGLVRFERTTPIAAPGCATLARFTTGAPAMVECSLGAKRTGDGRTIVVASDLDHVWNDFPRHAMFVPFVHEVIGYVAAARALSSDYLVADVPSGVPARPGIAALPSPPAADGARPRQIAVNVDPRESDPARLTIEEFQASIAPRQDADRRAAEIQAERDEDRQGVWRLLLVLMGATLVIESLVARRTV